MTLYGNKWKRKIVILSRNLLRSTYLSLKQPSLIDDSKIKSYQNERVDLDPNPLNNLVFMFCF